MKLNEVVSQLDEIEDRFGIYLKDELNIDSDVELIDQEGPRYTVVVKDGTTYVYLLEIFIAKEIVEDWLATIDYVPGNKEIAQRVFEYGVNDA